MDGYVWNKCLFLFCKTDGLPECRVLYTFAFPFVRPFDRLYIYSSFNYASHYVKRYDLSLLHAIPTQGCGIELKVSNLRCSYSSQNLVFKVKYLLSRPFGVYLRLLDIGLKFYYGPFPSNPQIMILKLLH